MCVFVRLTVPPAPETSVADSRHTHTQIQSVVRYVSRRCGKKMVNPPMINFSQSGSSESGPMMAPMINFSQSGSSESGPMMPPMINFSQSVSQANTPK